MPPLGPLRASDLRGLAALAEQATLGVTDIVEGVHDAVWRTLGAGGAAPGRTAGLTGLVYRIVRAGTGQAGALAQGLLRQLPDDDDASDSARRDALLAVLNGVVGDRLAASGNPLAIPMCVLHDGRPLDAALMARGGGPAAVDAARDAVAGAAPRGGRLLLMVHGLCMNDRQWQTRRDGALIDHGRAIAEVHGYTPLYLRYNSGRHIAHNGRELSALLERTLASWPQPVSELAILGHSMGGLVARSALQHGQRSGAHWPRRLRTLLFLGTPHHGAPLERAGNWLDGAFGISRYSAPFAALGRLRSAGITDLRFGRVHDDDGAATGADAVADRFARSGDRRRPLPLPAGVECHAIAATLATQRSALAERLLGDGLVPLRSALGQHDEPRHRLRFARRSQRVVFGIGHLDLLHDAQVQRQLLAWLERS